MPAFFVSETVMIGDDVRDDVLGAQKAGFKVTLFENLFNNVSHNLVVNN
jgi:predicted HAD superfamily phosphohydrolase YqeG